MFYLISILQKKLFYNKYIQQTSGVCIIDLTTKNSTDLLMSSYAPFSFERWRQRKERGSSQNKLFAYAC